jgi:acyl-CoA reductase-like NAD-dependent aldehyde dehydrogenase
MEGRGAGEADLEGMEQSQVLWKPDIDIPQVSGSSLIQCYAPATGQSLGRINPSTADGIDRAIAKAKDAQVKWAETSFYQRRRVLKTMLDASLGEILVTVEKLRWTIRHGEESLKSEKRDTSFLMMYKWNEVVWEPLGVVAACVSWK